jgi:hypothetical protein
MKKFLVGAVLMGIIIPVYAQASWWNPATWFKNENKIEASKEIQTQTAAVVEAVPVPAVIKDEKGNGDSDVEFLKCLIMELTAKNDSLVSELNKLKIGFESMKKTSQPDKKCTDAKAQYKIQTDKLFDLRLKRDRDIRELKNGGMSTETGLSSATNAFKDYYDVQISPIEIEVSRASRDMDLFCP